jgi:GNAT superfamily N-acetyltransferase
MIRIRMATLEDEAKIIDLLRQFPPSETLSSVNPIDWQIGATAFREIVKNDEKGTVLVAEQDSDVVGIITLSYPAAIRCAGIYSCIEEFLVSDQVRGKGVGSQLIEAAITEATSKGCYEIQVNNPSEMGYPVYLRHGLEDVGRHLKMKLPR